MLKRMDLYECFINSMVLCGVFWGVVFGFYMACYWTVRDLRCEFSRAPPRWAVVEAEGPGRARPRAEVWGDQIAAPCALGGAFQGDGARLFARVCGWRATGDMLQLKLGVHVGLRKIHCEDKWGGPSTEAVRPWGTSVSYWEMSWATCSDLIAVPALRRSLD